MSDKWTPIKEGPPPTGVPLIVTVHIEDNSRPDELAYPVFYQKDFYQDRWVFYDYMKGNEIGPNYFTVSAWRTFPRPYTTTEAKKEGGL